MLIKDDDVFCPIMTAGNVAPVAPVRQTMFIDDQPLGEDMPRMHVVPCLKYKCGLWNKSKNKCGLISDG